MTKYCDDSTFKKGDVLFCYLQFIQLWGATAIRCNAAAVDISKKRLNFGSAKYIQYHEI